MSKRKIKKKFLLNEKGFDGLRYGNCLFGAIRLMWKFKTWKIRILRRRKLIPHFYVEDNQGRYWHFHCIEDRLPAPVGTFLFKGRYLLLKKRPGEKECGLRIN